MNRLHIFILAVLVAAAAVSGQDTGPTDEPVSSTTANPGGSFGAVCNGVLLRCNHYSETVLCVQRRNVTASEAPVPSTNDPLVSVFYPRSSIAEEVCETGLTVDLGRCQCKRNCKNGVYVEDGEFDPDREICVGLVGSACSLVAPNCTPHAACNLVSSKCACNVGYVDKGDRRCVRAL